MIKIDPDGSWIILDGEWPTFAFVYREDVDLRCEVDLTEVVRVVVCVFQQVARPDEPRNPRPEDSRTEI